MALYTHFCFNSLVTPCAGVWIEITQPTFISIICDVTPCAGVWIEITIDHLSCPHAQSLPVRECGLKYFVLLHVLSAHLVTPCAGVWIEMAMG